MTVERRSISVVFLRGEEAESQRGRFSVTWSHLTN
jgi:hypothetical protein